MKNKKKKDLKRKKKMNEIEVEKIPEKELGVMIVNIIQDLRKRGEV